MAAVKDSRAKPRLLGRIASWLVRVIGSTLRIQTPGLEKLESLGTGVILCGWHGKSFVPAYVLRKRGVWVVISHSRDGEIQNQVFSRLGYGVIRGSTGRGGVRAAVEAIRVLKKGAWMAITPDGPRGPSGVVQGGVMLMAQKSGAALVPCGVGARPAWRAKSWDRYMVPIFFGRALFLIGEPLFVAEGATEDEVEVIRVQLEKRIHELDARAEAEV